MSISKKPILLFSAILVSFEAMAQINGRAAGNVVGRLLVYALIAFLVYRFIIRPLFNKKKNK